MYCKLTAETRDIGKEKGCIGANGGKILIEYFKPTAGYNGTY